MKKPKRDADVERTFVQLELRCKNCEKKIGNVFRMAGQHPRAGEEYVDARCSPRFTQRQNGGRTLTVTCTCCGAKPQTPREHVQSKLDELDHASEFRGLLSV